MSLLRALLGIKPDPKVKLKRKELMKRAREALPPVLAELGFADGRRRSKKGDGRDPLSWPFWRKRDGYWEEIGIDWDPRGRPSFSVTFWTEQIERMNPTPGPYIVSGMGLVLPGPYSRLERWRRTRPRPSPHQHDFEGRSVDELIVDACAKLQVLDRYLRTGEPREAVDIYQRAFTKDGEVYQAHPDDIAAMEEACAKWGRGNDAASGKTEASAP